MAELCGWIMVNRDEQQEYILSQQTQEQWQLRESELLQWAKRSKPKRQQKHTRMLEEGNHVDAQLFEALTQFRKIGIATEFSCAGVSLLDEPEDHSLYAYITFPEAEKTKRFVSFVMERMQHRLLVSYEAARKRYDLSSFYIGNNRRFCFLMEQYAKKFEQL